MKAAGEVGGTKLTFKGLAGSPEVVVNSLCVPELHTCVAETLFGSASGSGAEALGLSEKVSGKVTDLVSVERSTDLSSPKGTTRGIVAWVDASPPGFKGKVLTVTTSTSGIVTGSATLTGTKSTTFEVPCENGTKSGEVKIASFPSAKYVPASSPITGHSTLGGTLVPPKSNKASFDAQTVVSG